MSLVYNPQVITSGLFFYIDAATSGNVSTVSDISGRNFSATVNGPTYSQDGLGSWVFDGSNDYLRTSTLTGSPMGDFTIDSWINPSVITGDYRIISCNQTLDNFQLILTPTGTVLMIIGGGTQTQTSQTVPVNTWSHVAATRSGSAVTIYINSTSRATASNSTAISTTYLDIGYRTANNNHPFNGKISQYRLYNRSLTQQEVLQNYSSFKSRYGV